MTLSAIEKVFRASPEYDEALATFTADAVDRLSVLRAQYEALSAALEGEQAPAPAPRKTAAKKVAAAPAPPKAVELTTEGDDDWVVVEPENLAEAAEAADAPVVDLTESAGVWGDGEADDY